MKKIISLILSLILMLSVGVISVSADTMTNNEIMLSLLPTNIKAGEPVQSANNGVYYDAYILHEPDKTNEKYVELKNFTDNLIKDCTTDLEKVTVISNWVYENTEYKFGMLAGNSMDTIYGVFEKKMGNCECLTRLTNYMLYLIDIPAAIITSDKDGHEWGCALVNGEWIIVDSTNNWIGNDYLERCTIEAIAFSTPDNLCYVVAQDKVLSLSGLGLYVYNDAVRHPNKNMTISIPSFVNSFEKNALKFFGDNACWEDSDDLVIKGEKGTYAETYVLENYDCIIYSGNNFTAYKKHDNKVTSKAATCFEEGYKNKKNCNRCDKLVSEGTIVPKLSYTAPKIKGGKKKITINYKKVKDAIGFEVRYKIKGKWKVKTFKATKNVKKTIKKLKAGKYKVQVRVFSKTAYSNWSKTKNIKVK